MNRKVMSALLLSAAMCGGPAFAADLGGDCCADLEERVAELEATTARKGNRKVSLTVYGQVATAVFGFDNGDDSDVFVVDNGNSPSRFGFQGSAKINPVLTAGFLIEVGAISAGSNAVSNLAQIDGVAVGDDGAGNAGDGVLSLRFANWYLDHKQVGRLTVGRISQATDGIQEVDLVGTNLVSLPGINIGNKISIGGTNLLWENVARGFDGDRVNGVRYDTPTFGGFQIGTSFSEDDRYDVTLRYAGEYGGFRLAAGIGYGIFRDNADDLDGVAVDNFDEQRFLSGSASVQHVASGIFVTAFAGEREQNFNNSALDFTESNWGVRAGVAKNWFGVGNTVIYGEYNLFDNVQNRDAEAEIWGVSIIQNIDAAAMELFLSYKNYSTDVVVGGVEGEDMDVVFSGARIKF
jgi:predicted porin